MKTTEDKKLSYWLSDDVCFRLNIKIVIQKRESCVGFAILAAISLGGSALLALKSSHFRGCVRCTLRE